MQYPPGTAFMDGEFVPMAEAKISVLDWGFLRSDATYDVVHVWKGRFFRLDKHIERFIRSANRIRLDIGHGPDQLQRILAECVRRSGHEDAYVEMIVTRGVSPTFSRDPRDAINRFIAFAIPFGWILRPEQREDGLHIAISKVQRIAPEAVDPTVKNYHWLDLVMGLYDAYDRGAPNVVLSDGAGHVVEGPGFNLFAVRAGRVVTPVTGVLHGITRLTAIELLRELGVEAEQRPLGEGELRGADEVFATSTAGGVIPVTRIDDQPVGDGAMGALTRQLVERYWQAHTRPEWTTEVDDIAAMPQAAE